MTDHDWTPVLCAWCDKMAKGSAQHTNAVWFASCGRRGHGDNYAPGSDAWKRRA